MLIININNTFDQAIKNTLDRLKGKGYNLSYTFERDIMNTSFKVDGDKQLLKDIQTSVSNVYKDYEQFKAQLLEL